MRDGNGRRGSVRGGAVEEGLPPPEHPIERAPYPQIARTNSPKHPVLRLSRRTKGPQKGEPREPAAVMVRGELARAREGRARSSGEAARAESAPDYVVEPAWTR